MPWVKFSDDWYDDGKLAGAAPHVLAMWAVGLTWSARTLTDGIVPVGTMRTLIDLYDTYDAKGETVHPDAVAAELVDRGLWEPVPGGYSILNYGKYQPSRDEVLARREADAARKRPSGFRAESELESSEESGPSRLPVPDDPSSVVVDELGTCPQVPDEVWTLYAKLKASRSRKPIDNHASWQRTTIANAKREHGVEAARWWDRFEITPSELAAALVDGGAGRSWQPRRQESA
jgi:hypothetical protein